MAEGGNRQLQDLGKQNGDAGIADRRDCAGKHDWAGHAARRRVPCAVRSPGGRAHQLARARRRNLALKHKYIALQEGEVARSGMEVRQGFSVIACRKLGARECVPEICRKRVGRNQQTRVLDSARGKLRVMTVTLDQIGHHPNTQRPGQHK